MKTAERNEPDKDGLPSFPLHVEETVRAIAKLHAEYYDKATPVQRALDHTASLLGQPGLVCFLAFAALGWIGANLLALKLGRAPIDPPPFVSLMGASTLISPFIAVLILATQRREYQLARYREQLSLELALLNEQKVTKVIQLLEESRRDNPLLRDRVDEEADAMARSADSQSMHEAIRETHAEAQRIGGAAVRAARRPSNAS